MTAIFPTRPAKQGRRRAKADTAGSAVAFAFGRQVRGSPLWALQSLKSSAGPRLTNASAHQHDVSRERWRVAMTRQIGEISSGVSAVDARIGKIEDALRAMAPVPKVVQQQRSSPAALQLSA